MSTRKRAPPARASGSPSRAVSRTADSSSTKRRAADALRRLVEAAPLPQQLEQEVDAGKRMGRVATMTTPSSRKRVDSGALYQHLALLVHGMILITLTAKAQQGIVGGSASSSKHAFTPSAQVGARWLEAVTRYVGARVTLDDVAKVAAAFPAWVSVRWPTKVVAQRADSARVEMAPARDIQEPAGVGRSRVQEEGPAAATDAVLTPRIYVHRATVPAVEDAVACAVAAAEAEDAGGQVAVPWRDRIARLTASDAVVAQARVEAVPIVEAANSANGVAVSPGMAAVSTASPPPPPPVDVPFTAEEEALLSSLSPELRASLSSEKLRGVLAEMRREASGEVGRVFAELQRAQEAERVLDTYAHIRSLFGQTRPHLSAAALLASLEGESRHEGQRSCLAQLSLVLQLDGTGLTAVHFVEEAARGVKGRDPAAPVGIVRRPLRSLDGLAQEELRSVLVYLDRTHGSAHDVLASLQALRQGRDS